MISTFGCNNGLILAGARLFYAMANDGLFFKKAGALNKKAVPEFALWLQCFWAAALCLSGTYGDLLDYTTFVSLIFYIITIGGVIVLRFKEPHTERPYRVLAYPFLPILYMIVATIICILLMIAKPANTNYGLMIVAMGIPAYYITKIFTSHKA
jgi:APA family basic amino acid/polyamine antiporter